MSVLQHLLRAEAELLDADAKTVPGQPGSDRILSVLHNIRRPLEGLIAELQRDISHGTQGGCNSSVNTADNADAKLAPDAP